MGSPLRENKSNSRWNAAEKDVSSKSISKQNSSKDMLSHRPFGGIQKIKRVVTNTQKNIDNAPSFKVKSTLDFKSSRVSERYDDA